MELYGIGFSNIRFASENTNYIHTYNYRLNTFSEEVFIHEFLHTLERISKDNGYKTINLHDHQTYGYSEDGVNGLEEWYKDYLRCEIFDKNTNEYVGINEDIYSMKPTNESHFDFAIEVKFNEEPQNIFEEIKCLFNVVAEAI